MCAAWRRRIRRGMKTIKRKERMNKKKKTNWILTGVSVFACILLCFVLVQKPQRAKAADKDRTGWIPISNVDDLQKLFSDTGNNKYYLTNDIVLSRYGYWPGNYENDFRGTFDGNGHSISNLTSMSSGLFRTLLPGAVVENLMLLNVNINVNKPKDEYVYVGGIANIAGSEEEDIEKKITISNCVVTGEIHADYYAGEACEYDAAGGILGMKICSVAPLEIDSCISNAYVSCSSGDKAGILAQNIRIGGERVTISNCCDLQAGGRIAGSIGEGTISNCYADQIVGDTGTAVKIFGSYYYNNREVQNIRGLFKPTYLDSASSVKKSSYEGWDFDTVWMINKGINNGHPILRWVLPYANISAPYANMSAGTYDHEFRVELGSNVENVQIYYTTDGSKPTVNSKPYTGSIPVKGNMKLKLFSMLEGTIPTSTATYNYKIRCAVPKANCPDRMAFRKYANIKLSTSEPGASIYYTTDGTKPTAKSKRYTGGIRLTKNTTLKAITVKDGKTNSKALVMHYIVKRG